MAVALTGNARLLRYPKGRIGLRGEAGVWSGRVSGPGDASGGTLIATLTLPEIVNSMGFTLDGIFPSTVGDNTTRDIRCLIDPFIPGGPVIEWRAEMVAMSTSNCATRPRDAMALSTPLTPLENDPTIQFILTTNPTASVTFTFRAFGLLFESLYRG